MSDAILEVSHFGVSFHTYAGEVQAVRDVSFRVSRGEVVAIVGESGSGKSVLTQSLVRLLPDPPARVAAGGRVRFEGEDISGYSFRRLKSVKGSRIAYVFQDPMTSLNPLARIGDQVMEGVVYHGLMGRKRAYAYALELLRDAGIRDPERRMGQYPHELSGGMRQRVMIAIALAMRPALLVADEPTTALDVTTQAQILATLKELNRSRGMSIILITHDMGIVAGIARRVIVMYGGKVVESGSVEEIFERSRHPYTRSLLGSVPRLDADKGRELDFIVGSPPDMLRPPAGCPFSPRCAYAMALCAEHPPAESPVSPTHSSWCWLLHPGAARILESFARRYPDRIGTEAV
ncbi:MAG TPA: ABC transporter ATP-binding protein [Spirochaetales bacterium]|nr:ABC transporter ATP-binding protein [Spirochaetales bacterium]HRY54194.1 ABC transporter ATP-binding protein [Spirochaetia bacterium]HRZ64832.1 ABC transporter ATP-binding protein [Spirochaetia bacterium]